MLGATDVYIETGQKQYSGTGRNARVTNILALFDPYSAIPVPSLTSLIHRSQGDRIKPTRNLGVLASYWQEFGGCTYFDIYLEKAIGNPALVTQSGDKMVGGTIRFNNLKGAVVLLPPPNLDFLIKVRGKDFREALKSKKGTAAPTPFNNSDILKKVSRAVGSQFLSAILEIDKAIRASSERTATPNWAQATEYVLAEELSLKDALMQIEKQVAGLRSRIVEVESKLQAAGTLRGLLYETGGPWNLRPLKRFVSCISKQIGLSMTNPSLILSSRTLLGRG